MQQSNQLIHLLYVPTIYCNLGCTYCYLGEETDNNMLKKDFDSSLSTLSMAVDKFMEKGIVPFNISLHGGEVTTLPGHALNDLFNFIDDHYESNRETLNVNGFKKKHAHIKTNLYNFDKHIDLLTSKNVSISASVDLPLSLHEKYRVTKKGKSTLAKTLSNVRLLSDYPHPTKMSAVIYNEHIEKTDEIISDIWKLHNELKFNMNNFNFMFGFESSANDEKFIGTENLNTKAVSHEGQVKFYNRLKDEFLGTELEEGFKKHWFDEFTPSYCTNSFNCGEKFFLLQSDGNIYSCVRGQSEERFHYGNILEDSVDDIMNNARKKIIDIHREVGMHDDCKSCEYLSICHTGCPYVKNEQNSGKSYTCALQKEIYKDYPKLYPPTPPNKIEEEKNIYIVDLHPQLIEKDTKPIRKSIVLPNDLYDEGNSLDELIEYDNGLKMIFSSDDVRLTINGKEIKLESQILKSKRSIITLSESDSVQVHLSKKFLVEACSEPLRNTLHIQMLRDTPVIYGDEKRRKQEHVANFEIFVSHLECNEKIRPGFHSYDLTKMLKLYKDFYIDDVLNNMFITTQYLRRHHYQKQKDNAYYHIQAINLPFQNFEFYWKQGSLE